MDEDGFVYFKQRIKRVIISSGYNIYPQYIENIIDSHEDVLYSCVIGIPHAYKGQVAKAFVVLKNGEPGDEEKKEEVRTYCQERLAKYSWPYAYEFRKELPKTLVGKIAYRQLEEEEAVVLLARYFKCSIREMQKNMHVIPKEKQFELLKEIYPERYAEQAQKKKGSGK